MMSWFTPEELEQINRDRCQEKARYDDQTVADHYATKIRRRADKVSARGGPDAPNMRSYRCKFEDDGIHYHLTRGRKRKS